MRHAFLIIAHNNPEILYAQLEILDSVDVDFYFHLDAKMQIDKELLERHVSKSKIFYIKPKKSDGDTIRKSNVNLDFWRLL